MVWYCASYGSRTMKPACPCDGSRRFPPITYSFHAGTGNWRSYSSPYDGDDKFRKFHDFSREFLIESARERAKEMAVFGVVVIASAWPVIYMVITVVKLLLKGRPLGN
jgi:hypothetical protein